MFMLNGRAGSLASILLLAAAPLAAQTTLPPITVGGGVQTSFVHTSPDESEDSDEFLLNSVRLYVNGPVTGKINFTFNTEYNGATNAVGVLDAIARFEMSPRFNVWFGRLLPPSDRANLHGPYYSHHWAVYTDGIQDGYPFVAAGRDNGVVYWGDYGKVKVSAGAFDGKSATGDDDVIGAGRVQVNFWDPEPGYYLNGTYYGGKNILAVGAAVQAQSGDSAFTADFLLEKKLGSGSVVSVEAEYANYDHLGGYYAQYGQSDGGFVLGSFLFPNQVGMGKFELLGKYAQANFSEGLTLPDEDFDQKTTEINVNYIIKDFNARVMFFFKNTVFSAIKRDFNQFGVGIQLQI
jgi:hypothetical protein